MHELSLTQGIVEVIREQAVSQRFRRVVAVRPVIGALSNVEPEALEFGFDAASRGTPAEGAPLRMDRTPGEAFCLDRAVMVTSGDEMRFMDLEVE